SRRRHTRFSRDWSSDVCSSDLADGSLHVCFGVTEPGAGLDTTRITTFARRDGGDYVINGRKVWISKALESDKVLLLTRTTRYEEIGRASCREVVAFSIQW